MPPWWLRPAIQEQLLATLSAQRITACHLTPYLLSGLAAASRETDGTADLDLRWVSTDGDSLQGRQRDRFLAVFPKLALVPIQNQPEATIAAAVAPGVLAESPLPFGRPLGATRIYVLNRWGNLAPQGVLGEFFIESPCLASQMGSARTTAERLRPCPFASVPGARMLGTGRMGRHRQDGCLEQVGRRETSVVLRGQRFDLTEVRLALLSHPNLEEVEVVVDQLAGSSRLVALFTVCPDVPLPDQWAEHSDSLLRSYLTKILSGPMVPSAFVELACFPLNPDGSLNQAELRHWAENARDVSTTALNPPRTDAERNMQAIWAELLSVDPRRNRARQQLLRARWPLASGRPAFNPDPREFRHGADPGATVRHAAFG